jgi:Leucine-rich repeat (LRR) protein
VLGNNNLIDGSFLLGLSNLVKLNIAGVFLAPVVFLYSDILGNKVITGATVQQLTNLTYLNLSDNVIIQDENICGLSNLTSLFLIRNGCITDIGLQNLVNLTTLSLWGNKTITDEGLKTLFNLRILDIGDNPNITFKGIECSRETLQELYMKSVTTIKETDLDSLPKLLKWKIFPDKYYNPFWFNI